MQETNEISVYSIYVLMFFAGIGAAEVVDSIFNLIESKMPMPKWARYFAYYFVFALIFGGVFTLRCD